MIKKKASYKKKEKFMQMMLFLSYFTKEKRFCVKKKYHFTEQFKRNIHT